MNDSQSTSLPTIAQLRDNSLSSAVRHEIERMILSGELPTGSRLNENALAAKLGVSRGPIREASRALVELGLLDLIPSRGVFVRRMDKQDAQEIYDLRAGLTGLAGSLLAPKVTDGQLAQLRELFGAMDAAAMEGDFQSFYGANLEFHDLIVSFTENSRLIKAYRALVKEFHLFRSHGLVQRDAQRLSNEEHRAILESLEERDPAAAYETSFRHVANGKARMMTALDNLAQAAPGKPTRSKPGSLHVIE
ncbi:GntR family transcriptional regulator [Skermanella stibiiresistens SB22]|uniref:GntR family transcriptional regulator n=1 Tax=Skermanella stibiiresistens SB22 TaxID=1385369 RepID=W9HCU7_9PROT|nr:FCD domain-containing protein [Skermanella stibiiresistens]EWY41693.1 GntR family transcriptional regulator [Skermanella stibiiresistens SB22]